MQKNSLFMKIIILLIYSLVVLSICLYARKNTYYDFDILLYSACAIQSSTDSPETLHEKTYTLAKRDLPAQKFRLLTDSANIYRNSLYKNPQNFSDQLPFYKIKPLYVWLLSAASQSGLSPFYFSTWLNLFSYAVLAFVLFFYLGRFLGFYKGAFMALCGILMPILLDTAKNNTPDMLATLLFFVASLLLMARDDRSRYFSVFLFCLLLLLRPENIFFILAFCSVCFLFKNSDYPRSFLGILLFSSICCFFYTTLIIESYPWALLYKHSFLGFLPEIKDPHVTLSIKEYLIGFKKLPSSVFYSDFFLVIFFLTVPVLFVKGKGILFLMAYACLLSILIRVLLFPDLSSRFYAGYYVISLVVFMRIYSENIRTTAPVSAE